MASNVAAAEDPIVLRGPSPLEQWSTVRHSLGFYHAVGMTARYHPPSSISPGSENEHESSLEALKASIYPALKKIIDQHPPLSVSLVDESTVEAHFVRLRRIDLDSIVSFAELPATDNVEDREKEIDRVAASNHSRQFERLGHLPLWRLIILIPPHWRDSNSNSATVPNNHGVDIALFIHHAVADGGSAQIFHSSLLAALNSASEGEPAETPSSPVVDVRTDVPFLPPMENIIDMRISWLALIKAIFGSLFYRPPRSLWTGRPVFVPDTPLESDLTKRVDEPKSGPYKVRTEISHFILEASTAAALTKQCRKNRTSMTALFETLVSVAFFEYLAASGNSEAKQLTSVCAMNARRFMGQKAGGSGQYEDQMGVFIETTEHFFARSDIPVGPPSGSTAIKAGTSGSNGEVSLDWKAVWDVARKVKETLEKKIRKGMQDSTTGLLRYVRSIRGMILGYLGQKRARTFEVSNVGLVDGGLETAERGWTISRMMFSQSANVIGPVIAFSVCTIKGGDMCVAGTWQEEVIEAQVAHDIVGRVKVLLENVAVMD